MRTQLLQTMFAISQLYMMVLLCNVHRFSKELLAFLETLVAFSPYYRANDPRAAGAMDNYYTDTLKDYGNISYDTPHNCLIDELTDWYQRFPPAKTVDSDEEPDGGAYVGEVVDGRCTSY